MACLECSSEVPSNQAIFPDCYALIRMPAATAVFEGKPNLLHFLSSTELNCLYSGHVQSHLQPDRIASNFYADSEDAFRNITGNSGGAWPLILIDRSRGQDSRLVLQEFSANNPSATIVILGTSDPDAASEFDSIMVRHPHDIDSWLKLMHALLKMVGC